MHKRLALATSAIVVVIVLVAATAIAALRTTEGRVNEAREIDRRLATIDQLRNETRDMALSARRKILSGDLKEQQRVLAIIQNIRIERTKLNPRASLVKGAELEAQLDEYAASLVHAMSFDDDNAVARLSRFEDELARIRAPLSLAFDDIISRERSRREELRSAESLARAARWAVLVASVLSLLLVVTTARSVVRKLAPLGETAGLLKSRNELIAAAAELRAPLETMLTDAAQLRTHTKNTHDARLLDNIARNVSRVNGMLTELLDVTALQTGNTALRREPVDATMLVDGAIRDHRELALQRELKLRYESQLSITVFVDRERIRHVVDSLLQIAIAAARPGAELVLQVAAAGRGVRFAIIEPGPGADPIAIQDLALHLCSRVVEAHGGRLGMQASTISRTYWFTLPNEQSLLR